MNWITIPLLLATLAWTALFFLAYNDWVFALKSSLPAWVICAAVWALMRWTFAGRHKRRSLFKKAHIANRRRLHIAGLAVAISLGVIAFVLSAGKWLQRGNGSGKDSLPVAPKNTEEQGSGEPSQKLPTKNEAVGSLPVEKTLERTEDPWSVQIGAFRSEQNAVELATTLKNKGYEAYVIRSEADAVILYRTKVGRFRTREEAEKLLIKLKEKEDYPAAFVAGM